jgi:hypothetical protein
MKRTTKAMARLGTLAVIAGTALGTPLAIGTASAVVPTDVTVVNGTIVTNEVAAAQDASANANNGSITIAPGTGTDINDNDIIQLSGSAYFPDTATQLTASDGTNTGNVTVISPTKAKCPTGNATCIAIVDDPAAEQITFSVIDPNSGAPTNDTTGQISFNGLFFNGCPGTGIDVGRPAGANYGLNAPQENTPQNCATQGSFGGALTLITVHYSAPAPATANQNQNLDLELSGGGARLVQQAGSSTIVDPGNHLSASCTTDASGNCTVAVVDPGPNPQDANAETTSFLTASTHFVTGLYPSITSTPPGGMSPSIRIRWSVGPVTPQRLNLIAAQVVAPDTQNSDGSAPEAEPGDAVQLTYFLTDSCTPDPGFETCIGQKLAGVSTTVSVDEGFFTPNCQQVGGVAFYEGCSFTTTPANGVKVGDLTQSGQTETVTTGVDGTFTVTVGMARDQKFDNNGTVVSHVTDGTLHSVRYPGNINAVPGDGRTTGTGCKSADDATVLPATLAAPGIDTLTSGDDQCPIDFSWTTNEQPLNGGKAVLHAFPRLVNPSNVFINSENNYDPTDPVTGLNIPDVGRVVFDVHATDQFGNLTSNDYATNPTSSGGPGGVPQNPLGGVTSVTNSISLTKTGVGSLWACAPVKISLQDFTSTNPCTGAGVLSATFGFPPASPSGEYLPLVTQHADGTIDQSSTVVGSYLDGPAQARFQVDAAPTASDGMVGCYQDPHINVVGLPLGSCDTSLIQLIGGLLVTGVDLEVPGQNMIGLDDGTQNVTLDWTAPTTTFTSFIAGSPNVATYAAGNAADAPDAWKLNIYNQLAAPVVKFGVTPGNKVQTSQAVTVTGTVGDQFGNGIVGWNVQFVRSGGNESSCTPIQNGENNAVEVTNQGGVAGYTFTCDAPGTANVSIVVKGPGGVELASGREAVTFTGVAIKVKTEKPSIKVTSHKAGHLTVRITTHPRLAHVRINIFRKLNGLYHLIGSVKTGAHGKAVKHLGGLHRGVKYHISAKAVGLGAGYHSKYAKHKNVRIA